jgi:hypothetical protein
MEDILAARTKIKNTYPGRAPYGGSATMTNAPRRRRSARDDCTANGGEWAVEKNKGRKMTCKNEKYHELGERR